MRGHQRARVSRIGPRSVHERPRARLGVAGFPESAERSARGDDPERRNVGDHGEDAAGARFEERIAAAFPMAAEHEQIRSTVERRQPLVRHRPEESVRDRAAATTARVRERAAAARRSRRSS